jgi:hypothetical protein
MKQVECGIYLYLFISLSPLSSRRSTTSIIILSNIKLIMDMKKDYNGILDSWNKGDSHNEDTKDISKCKSM